MTDGDPAPVIVRLPQALAEHAGGARELHVDVGAGASLGDLLREVGRTAPAVGRRVQDETGAVRRFVNVYVGQDECRTLDGLDTAVAPGAVVYVIPSVAGGNGAGLDDWIAAVCFELGLDATVDVDAILDVARIAAHGVERPAAPVTTFLLGLAVARGTDLADASGRIESLAEAWPTHE